MAKLQKVLMMAGGTGGHVFPGLAVANALRAQGVEVHWLGTEQGLEAKIVPEAGIPLHYISVERIRGQGLTGLIATPFHLLRAIVQSLRVIHQLQPDVVIGMGGFVSGPGGIVAWLLRKPLIIHEQNAKAGLTNRWLARVATKVLEGFPGTFAKQNKLIATGNPVRREITDLPAPSSRSAGPHDKMHLLVVGGSLGASAINALVPQALAKMSADYRPEVYHQTGERHIAETLAAYQAAGVTANVVPFIKNMEQAYPWADLVLCRAGALTIAELCAAGLGSILVPFPHAADDHQTANAGYLVQNDAALLVQQADLSAEGLAEMLTTLAQSPAQRTAMAEAAYALRKADATAQVLKICEEVCQ